MAVPFDGYAEWLERLRRNGEVKALASLIAWLNREGRVDGMPLIAESRTQQASYVAMRLDGQSHKLAEMLALGIAPALMTDNVFLQGHCNGNQFEQHPALGDYYARVAARHGQDTHGKVYLSGLAAFPGDPRAWISSRHDVQKLLTERGWGCEGAVNTRITKVAEPLNIPVAPDLVEEAVDDLIEREPEAAHENREDLAEKMTNQMKPHWA